MFRPTSWLDRVFAVGIIGKGLNGAAEVVGGVLLLVVSPARLYHLVAALTQAELSEDRHDFIATHLLHTASGLDGGATLYGPHYRLSHGAVKLVLVVALLRDKMWAYPWMIGVLGTFIAYQLYRIALQPAAGLVALPVFDVLIVALTWREMREQHRRRRSLAADTENLVGARAVHS